MSALDPTLLRFFSKRNWQPLHFQEQTWDHYARSYNGLVNAPTGSGKTYSLYFAFLQQCHQERFQKKGLQLIWLTPIRALAEEIRLSMQKVVDELALPLKIGIRTGDTSSSVRQQQAKAFPDVLITTPESLHLLLSQKDRNARFANLKAVVVDEWHELLSSKRGVQVELALAHLKQMAPIRIWGISATIGNLDQALEVLLGDSVHAFPSVIIRAETSKVIQVASILPDKVEKFPWAGHLGIHMLEKVLPIIDASQSTLLFTNTRAQAEIWYQRLLDTAPELAGVVALHHGSLSMEIRHWVEQALHEGRLKCVVCTSSLDLGVDFRPVETIIQIGSPKGVSRFVQRAGRSGHAPGQLSKIYFVPTHSLELVEGAALRLAISEGNLEERTPVVRAFDVLIQFLVTLSLSDGFEPQKLYHEVKSTHAYASISPSEWDWVLQFITQGGPSLEAYTEFSKVVPQPDGRYQISDKRMALRHRLSIGTILSDTMMRVKFLKGGFLGTIEEWFITWLNPGDVFWFAGRSLELYQIKGLDVLVRKSDKKTGKVPSYMGGRMPLSSNLSTVLRQKLGAVAEGHYADPETQHIRSLFDLQARLSSLPSQHQFLIESTETNEGHHLFFYPFDGRFVHEGLASLVAYRIAQKQPITFSLAYNDYGFELLSDQKVDIEHHLLLGLFSTENLVQDLTKSVNYSEMMRRRFREIAQISGLLFNGFPGKPVKTRHLQASSQLFFDVFMQYEPDSLLLKQAYEEVLYGQLEESRLRISLERINQQTIVVKETKQPSPFSFPILVDRLREKLSSEKLEDRIKKMTIKFEKG